VITIVIATYGEEYWESLARERALPSVMHLEANHEIIIGHSPDASIADVRNGLAAEATGEWLCFLDADDELDHGYVAAMEENAQPRHLLTPRVMQVINGRRKRAQFYREVNLLSGNWLIVGTLVERSLFEEVGGFGDYPHGFEDWSLWYKCARVGAKVKKVPSAIYVQHVNPDSKHRQGWRDRNYQVSTHLRVQAELEAWTP
jgi:glycosyltransferase involved in cell wall biosynthesis